MYVELLPDDIGFQEGYVGRLALALYGTRDAASLWQECLAQHLTEIGFVRGRSMSSNIARIEAAGLAASLTSSAISAAMIFFDFAAAFPSLAHSFIFFF